MISQSRVAAAVLISLQCLLLGNLNSEFLFPAIVAVLSMTAIVVSIPIHRWAFAGCILIAAFAATAETCWYPPNITTDWILPGRYVSGACKFLVLVQLIELWRTSVGSPLPQRFSAIVLAAFLLAFCRTETFGNAMFFYAIAVALAAAFACLGTLPNLDTMPNSQQPGNNPGEGSGFRTLVLVVAIVGIALGTSHIANTANSLTASLRYFVGQKVVDKIKTDRARVAFTADGRLDSVTQMQQHLPDLIVVAATCEVMPGYLRGRVFNRFENDRWNTNKEVRRLVPLDELNQEEFRAFESKVELDPTYRVFKVGAGNPETIRRIQIANSKSLIGKITFSPLSVDYFAYHNRFVKLDEHDVFQDVVSSRRPYQMFVARDREPFDLDPQLKQQLLQVPADIQSPLQNIALEICADASTIQEKIARIEEHFQTQFDYSLDSPCHLTEKQPFSRFRFESTCGGIVNFLLRLPPCCCDLTEFHHAMSQDLQ